MRKHLGITLVLPLLMILAGTPGCQSSVPTKAQAAKDEAEIRATVESLNSICAKRDGPGFLALFDDSDEIMFIGSDQGEIAHGRKEVQGFIEMLFRFKITFSFDLKNIYIKSNGDSAWLFFDGNMIHTSAAGKQNLIPYRYSITLVKREGRWRWQIFHGSMPRGE